MEAMPSDEANKLDTPEEARNARIAAVDALKARIKVEEEAERSKLRADEALQAQRAAEEAAEQARLEAKEAEQAQLAADEEAERARLAAEEALQAWRGKLAMALEAEAAANREEASAPAGELHTILRKRVTDRPGAPAEAESE
jgi:hypothetical protein